MSSNRNAGDAIARAKLARDGWGGLNARADDRGAVHAVDLDGDGRPLPHCRTGLSGWDPARMSPTLDPVTCELCRRRTVPPEARAPGMPGQSPLWVA